MEFRGISSISLGGFGRIWDDFRLFCMIWEDLGPKNTQNELKWNRDMSVFSRDVIFQKTKSACGRTEGTPRFLFWKIGFPKMNFPTECAVQNLTPSLFLKSRFSENGFSHRRCCPKSRTKVFVIRWMILPISHRRTIHHTHYQLNNTITQLSTISQKHKTDNENT